MPNDARQSDWTVDPARKTYALALGEDSDRITIGGEADASKFAAEISLTRWGGAASLGLRLPGVASANALVDTAAKRVRIEPDADSEFRFWPVGDELHFGWLFKRRPKTNRWAFEMPGHEQFDFHFQPALTQEEIDEGSVRPEHVVGSWAIYHKALAHNRYRTGKAWHIYRPRFVDALGNATWADVHIDRGEYLLELPQKWLDNATYPVSANDTFGYTSVGGTEYTLGWLNTNPAALSEDAELASISVYWKNVANFTTRYAKHGLFAADGSAPGDRLINGIQGSLAPQYEDWLTISMSDYALDAGTYWFGWQQDNTDAHCFYDTVAGYNQPYRSHTYSSAWPDPWSGAGTNSNRRFSVYGTYSVPPPPNYFAAYQPPPSFLGPPPPLTGLPY